jgi:hypothetical protein
MTNITPTPAAQFGSEVGKTLGRLACGGETHFDRDVPAYDPPLTLEVKLGDEVVLSTTVSGFDVRREQTYAHRTRILLLADEPA